MVILVVDHDVEEQERYAALLARSGMQSIPAETGDRALEIVSDPTVKLDAALILWELRGRPGAMELLPKIRRAKPALPVLVVGDGLNVANAALAKQRGASDFLDKAHVRERLDHALLRAIAGRDEEKLLEGLRATMVGKSELFLSMLNELASAIKQGEEHVLVTGENGTGKELVARALHNLGPAKDSPFVVENVAGIPAGLMESYLFGHEAGSFTSAKGPATGLFERTGNGTLFLDEIGELDLTLEPKLLRVLEGERGFRKVGGHLDLKFKGRLVCATNRDLFAEVKSGRFRQDLYNRIAGFEIRVPPLRERGNDRWLLVDHFLKQHGRERQLELSPEARALLAEYPFQGNIRELDKILKRAVVKCQGNTILPFDLPIEIMDQREIPRMADNLASFAWPEELFNSRLSVAMGAIAQAFNQVYLPRKLKEAGGKKERAAELSGLDPKTFRQKWKDAGLE